MLGLLEIVRRTEARELTGVNGRDFCESRIFEGLGVTEFETYGRQNSGYGDLNSA